MQIIREVDYIDLRTLRIQSAAMHNLADAFKLKNGQAILFSNERCTRFRLVAKMAGILHICIPETDEKGEVAMYAMVAGVYEKLTVSGKKREELSALVQWAEHRVRRREGRV